MAAEGYGWYDVADFEIMSFDVFCMLDNLGG